MGLMDGITIKSVTDASSFLQLKSPGNRPRPAVMPTVLNLLVGKTMILSMCSGTSLET